MRKALIDCISILTAAVVMHLAIRLMNVRMPEDRHWEDKTWTEFFATQFRLYYPTVAARFTWKFFAVVIAVGLVAYIVTSTILLMLF
jgi:hypothetical protein